MAFSYESSCLRRRFCIVKETKTLYQSLASEAYNDFVWSKNAGFTSVDNRSNPSKLFVLPSRHLLQPGNWVRPWKGKEDWSDSGTSSVVAAVIGRSQSCHTLCFEDVNLKSQAPSRSCGILSAAEEGIGPHVSMFLA